MSPRAVFLLPGPSQTRYHPLQCAAFIEKSELTTGGSLSRPSFPSFPNVLRSGTDAGFYIGFSSNLTKTLRDHENGAAFATSYRGPWKLIYYEAYLEREDALGRERYLKSGNGRRFLKSQLSSYLKKNSAQITA
jgi:putative endonuclease